MLTICVSLSYGFEFSKCNAGFVQELILYKCNGLVVKFVLLMLRRTVYSQILQLLFGHTFCRYAVFMAKYRDGFTLWPSPRSYPWTLDEVGPQSSVIYDFMKAVSAKNMYLGFSYTLEEEHNSLYQLDKKHHFKTQEFTNFKSYPELKEVVHKYHPDILYVDSNGAAPSDYWRAAEFVSWLYNDSPVTKNCIVNDKWGKDVEKKHGDFFAGRKFCKPSNSYSKNSVHIISVQ